MSTVLSILLIVDALFMIVTVLMQSSNDDGMSALSGRSNDSYFSKSKAKTMEARLALGTKIAAGIFHAGFLPCADTILRFRSSNPEKKVRTKISPECGRHPGTSVTIHNHLFCILYSPGLAGQKACRSQKRREASPVRPASSRLFLLVDCHLHLNLLQFRIQIPFLGHLQIWKSILCPVQTPQSRLPIECFPVLIMRNRMIHHHRIPALMIHNKVVMSGTILTWYTFFSQERISDLLPCGGIQQIASTLCFQETHIIQIRHAGG